MRLNLPMLLAAITLFVVEVIIATKLNDYHFIRAYFGDFLVVILVYCAVKAFWNVEPKRLAIGVFAFAVAVELAQLFRLADVLQLTGWARVVLGTSFSFHDVWMYAAGCLVVWWVDTHTMKRHIIRLLGVVFILGIIAIGLLQWWTAAQSPNAIAAVGGENITTPTALVMGKYPYYRQADPAWATLPVGNDGETMAAVGCTLTSIAMGLSGLGHPLTPGEVNEKLTQNGGFTKNGYVIWGKVATLTEGAIEVVTVDNSYARLDRELTANRPVIVKVLLGGVVQHWVLVVGKEGREYIVLDPLNKAKQPVPLSSLSNKIYAMRVFTMRKMTKGNTL